MGFVKQYWEGRYKKGGNSGLGSHEIESIIFKSNYINKLIKDYKINTLVELGCGDGNQLKLFKGYNEYVGYDISDTIVDKCSILYKNDKTKKFTKNISEIKENGFDLALSLDVIYHLVEEDVFINHMDTLFNISDIICLYTTNKVDVNAPHIKHRLVEDYVKKNHKDFKLIDKSEFNKHDVMFLLYKKI